MRKLRNPLKDARADNWQDTQRILADIHTFINPVSLEITADYSVPQFDGVLYLLCTNSGTITITHTDSPKDLAHLVVARVGTGAVSIAGNGININGASSLSIASQYDVADVQFFEAINRHLVVN
mgnify:CR=1 FL=1